MSSRESLAGMVLLVWVWQELSMWTVASEMLVYNVGSNWLAKICSVARELAGHGMRSDSGGCVNGVSCACPKCFWFRIWTSHVISNGSVTSHHGSGNWYVLYALGSQNAIGSVIPSVNVGHVAGTCNCVSALLFTRRLWFDGTGGSWKWGFHFALVAFYAASASAGASFRSSFRRCVEFCSIVFNMVCSCCKLDVVEWWRIVLPSSVASWCNPFVGIFCFIFLYIHQRNVTAVICLEIGWENHSGRRRGNLCVAFFMALPISMSSWSILCGRTQSCWSSCFVLSTRL